jgi:hypothetical protein
MLTAGDPPSAFHISREKIPVMDKSKTNMVSNSKKS